MQNAKNGRLKKFLCICHTKKTYAEDAEQQDKKQSKIDLIERKIEIIGELDQEQKERLIEIGDKCPVHRTLLGEIQVKSVLKE